MQKNCKFAQKHTVTDSDNSNKNQNEYGDLKSVKVMCFNSNDLPNDAKRSGIKQNRSEKIELYRILKHEKKKQSSWLLLWSLFMCVGHL